MESWFTLKEWAESEHLSPRIVRVLNENGYESLKKLLTLVDSGSLDSLPFVAQMDKEYCKAALKKLSKTYYHYKESFGNGHYADDVCDGGPVSSKSRRAMKYRRAKKAIVSVETINVVAKNLELDELVNFGKELGLSQETVAKLIQQYKHYGIEEVVNEMMLQWIQRTMREATIQKLVDILMSVKRDDVAKEIAQSSEQTT